MGLAKIINSPAMWLASGVMVFVVVSQSLLYLREALKAARKMSIPRSHCRTGIRAAMVTAIGPSLGPVVILLALIAVLGAPTTWMRLNDIGAARTELAIATLAAKVSGVELRSAAYDLRAFSYSIWGMALNNLGWMAVALICVSRMDKTLTKLNEKCDPRWVKFLMTGAAIGLFAYLWIGPLMKGGGYVIAGIVSFVSMRFISKVCAKWPRLQEPALGVAMLIGIFVAAAITS